MPTTFTRHQIEAERNDTGDGGKPPLHRRPTGGGGGDDNGDSGHSGSGGPRELLMRYRLGVVSILAADFVLFSVLISTFFIDGPPPVASGAHPLAIPPILWLNTLVLLLSTITVEIARRQLFHEIDVMEEWLGLGRPAVRRALPWLIATIALGCLFLAGQVIAWKEMAAQGLFFTTDPGSHVFYLLTGTQGIHLLVGVGALFFALVAMFRLRKVQMRQIAVDCTAWYWHAMGVYWVFIFGVLVFSQRF